MTLSRQCTIALPSWVEEWARVRSSGLSSSGECMALVIDVARENIRQGTGGPFGAAVVDSNNGKLVSLGVNLVTSAGLSIAHAEMVAISLAQHRMGQWDLSQAGNMSLITTCEPCAMCFGAVPWSGVRKLVCGARKSDAQTAGFDEGDKPIEWVQSLRDRGIEVELDVMRSTAVDIFRLYRASGGEIYNAGPESD